MYIPTKGLATHLLTENKEKQNLDLSFKYELS